MQNFKPFIFALMLFAILFSSPLSLEWLQIGGERDARTVEFYINDLIVLVFSIPCLSFFFRFKLRSYVFWYLIFVVYATGLALIHWLSGNTSLVSLCFTAKYGELFVVFAFGYFLGSGVSQKWMDRLVIIAGVAALGAFAYQVVTDNLWGYYGAGLPGSKGPSHEGYVLATLSALCALTTGRLRNGWQKIGNIVLCFGLFGFTIGTGSRISIIALAIFFLWHLRKRWWALCLVPASVYLLMYVSDTIDNTGTPLQRFTSDYMFNPSGRVEKWEDHLSLMGLQDWLIGKGSGFRGSIGGDEITGFGMDNLLARLVWDFGLGGLVCFGIMLVLLLRRGLLGRVSSSRSCFLSVVFVMLVHNVTHELFFIMKTSDLFWFLMGYCEYQMGQTKQSGSPIRFSQGDSTSSAQGAGYAGQQFLRKQGERKHGRIA